MGVFMDEAWLTGNALEKMAHRAGNQLSVT